MEGTLRPDKALQESAIFEPKYNVGKAREAQERLHTTLREGEENKWVDQMIAKAWENIKTPQDHTL